MSLNLDTRVETVTASRDIRNTLSVQIAIRGQNNVDLHNGEISVFVQDSEGDGRSLLFKDTIYLNTKLHSQRDTTFTVDIPLTHSDLERIEDKRGGGDLNYIIEGSVMGRDRRSEEFDAGSFDLTDRIPHSDWANILSTYGYGDIKVLELRFPESPAKEYFESAWNHIENADENFSRGNWGATLTECRQAIEVISNLERAEDLDDLLGEEKWDRMGTVKGNFSGFLSLGPHSEEGVGHQPINRRDAQVSLLLSKGLVNYVADALRERDQGS